jgi:hypothetical protein
MVIEMVNGNDHTAAMEHASAKRVRFIPDARAYLGTHSPKDRYQHKLMAVLEWIYRWGYTSDAVIQAIVGTKRPGFGKKLVDAGWLATVRAPVNADVRNLYLLSDAGLAEAARRHPEVLPYPEAHGRISGLVRHRLAIQWIVLANARDSHLSEREVRIRSSELEHKAFDALIYRQGREIGIEAELSPKYGPKLDAFLLDCLDWTDHASRHVIVATDSEAILRNYQTRLAERELLRHTLNANGHWQPKGRVGIDPGARCRIHFARLTANGVIQPVRLHADGSLIDAPSLHLTVKIDPSKVKKEQLLNSVILSWDAIWLCVTRHQGEYVIEGGVGDRNHVQLMRTQVEPPSSAVLLSQMQQLAIATYCPLNPDS